MVFPSFPEAGTENAHSRRPVAHGGMSLPALGRDLAVSPLADSGDFSDLPESVVQKCSFSFSGSEIQKDHYCRIRRNIDRTAALHFSIRKRTVLFFL